ncbi:2-succinyl-5-enolpyruvyl-6-hydroxy-3-cyclohexene-1-carboxylic-acid synthase [Gryllotalpicola ginsengisoli]|uniref:2-succinyl-5-enolpyruvyl-6-hydroxy-3- cyclohexene-1-carboxylic-acid synthase n=1 Tax=Gryllotalpicola ginsengisoli TaxID=444608 RepID=UPI0003B3A8DC|nr:2-succinyl-5-enolpyruvyl-6-hydroxy-3-cyclohexene-1-carboxylic-acid synthase [Gryllotalpicola ginsengisoli]
MPDPSSAEQARSADQAPPAPARILPTGNDATDFSLALLTALVRHGVRHLVVSPGSRSQAPALVAAELERVGAARLHVRIDERVAGFLALGLARESGTPAVVITTSGTATANLHPAVLEARAARVPMIVVTADRPGELRGIRANQTANQLALYGAAATWFRDVHAEGETDAASLASELWGAARQGPAHLNLALRDPLSAPVPDLSPLFAPPAPADSSVLVGATGADEHKVTNAAAGQAVASADSSLSADGTPPGEHKVTNRDQAELGPEVRTVVIAGDSAGPEAEELARAGGWPLIAEASSLSRFGPNLVVAYRELLTDPDFGGEVRRAIVFGHPTLSREVPALLSRPGVEAIVVDPSDDDEFYDPGHSARRVGAVRLAAFVDPGSPEAREWTGRWVFAGRRLVEEAARREAGADQVAPDPEAARSRDPATRAAYVRGELAAVREPVTRRMLADAVWRYTWPHDRLVLGASRLIRELDRSVPGKKITVYANRGLGGIDGTIATGLGVAAALHDGAALREPQDAALRGPQRTGAGVTRVLLGDLTLLHDAGALLQTPGERTPPIQVIVGDDRGGSIFAGLEVAQVADAAAFERVQLTPRDVDLEALARAYGWRYVRAATRGELDQALSAVTAEPTLIHVPLA